MMDRLDVLFTLEALVTALAATGTFMALLALVLPLLNPDRLAKRKKAVGARRAELARQQKLALNQGPRARLQPKRHVDVMRRVLDRLKLQNLIASPAMKQKLAQAGWRHQSAAVVFGFARFATPLIFLGLVGFFFTASSKLGLLTPMGILAVVVAVVVGFYLPNVIVTNAVQKRQQIIAKAFPDALDLLVICVEAGLSIEAAFSRVAEEIGEGCPELAEEFGLTTAELTFLGSRRAAFSNMAERTGLQSTRTLATTLIQSEKYGTPVSVALRVLAQENRDNRMAAAEKKAGALPAQLTVPMIVFFLPVLFLVILGPAIIQTIETLS